ncbi:MAG TPA: hypothetical protein VJ830_11350 [Anaerolineales bacterium]|nr:hypothetical protein [Anaerolineales bacterium]
MSANTGFPWLCVLAAEDRFEPLLEYLEEIIGQRQELLSKPGVVTNVPYQVNREEKE